MRHLFILLILLAAGCLQSGTPATTSTSTTILQELVKTISEQEVFECIGDYEPDPETISGYAFKSQDPSFCNYITDDEWYLGCINFAAGSIDDCDVANNASRMKACRDFFQARDSNDPAICKSMDNERTREYCLYEVALWNGDLSICADLNTERREDCMTFAARDPIYQQIFTLRDPKKCDLMTDPTNADQCRTHLARRYGEQKTCMKISEPSGRDYCLHQVAVVLGDPQVCEGIASDNISDTCKEYSSNTKDSFIDFEYRCLKSSCDAYKEQSEKDKCLLITSWNFIEMTKEEFEIEFRKADCGRFIYTSGLEGIEALDLVQSCEDEVIMSILDKYRSDNNCQLITTPLMRDKCLAQVILCEDIKNSTIKKKCFDSMHSISYRIGLCPNMTVDMATVKVMDEGVFRINVDLDGELEDLLVTDIQGECEILLTPNMDDSNVLEVKCATPTSYGDYTLNIDYQIDGAVGSCPFLQTVERVWD